MHTLSTVGQGPLSGETVMSIDSYPIRVDARVFTLISPDAA